MTFLHNGILLCYKYEESVEPISFIRLEVVERPKAKINVPNTPHSNRYEVSEDRIPPFTYI